jgi:hypothetical protein
MKQEQANLRKQDADRLYTQFVKPLEQAHQGKYATVNLSGETLLTPTLLDAILKADTFKIGAKVVGKIR